MARGATTLLLSVLVAAAAGEAHRTTVALVNGPSEVKTVSFVLLSQDVAQAKPLVLDNSSTALWTGSWSEPPPAAIYSAVQSATFVNGFAVSLAQTAEDTKLNGTVLYNSPNHHIQLDFSCIKGGPQDKCSVDATSFKKDHLQAYQTFIGPHLVYTAVFGA